MKNICAHWFPIIYEESQRRSSSGSRTEFGLNALLGLGYGIYFPFYEEMWSHL